MKEQERHYGRFAISRVFLEVSPEAVQRIYKEVIPTKVEFIFCTDTFEVTGTSKLFDQLKEGEQIPEYKFRVNTFRDKEAELAVSKVEC